MYEKPAPTLHPLNPVLSHRWSTRSFDTQKRLEPEAIDTLLEAAQWSPSCMNDQPWRFMVCDKQRHYNNWQKLLDSLGEKNRLWAKNAPVLILAASHKFFYQSDKSNRWAEYDTGAAVMALSIQATAMGLFVHQMGGFDALKVQQDFGIDNQFQLMSIMAIGYPADPSHLTEELKQKEYAARTRRPSESWVSVGDWSL